MIDAAYSSLLKIAAKQRSIWTLITYFRIAISWPGSSFNPV